MYRDRSVARSNRDHATTSCRCLSRGLRFERARSQPAPRGRTRGGHTQEGRPRPSRTLPPAARIVLRDAPVMLPPSCSRRCTRCPSTLTRAGNCETRRNERGSAWTSGTRTRHQHPRHRVRRRNQGADRSRSRFRSHLSRGPATRVAVRLAKRGTCRPRAIPGAERRNAEAWMPPPSPE